MIADYNIRFQYAKLTALLMLLSGCHNCQKCHNAGPAVWAPAPVALGTRTDEIMSAQEVNAEASKYVIYANEFQMNTSGQGDTDTGGWRLTQNGEDHVQQIAANLQRGDQFPVVLERSETSVKPGAEHGYPVYFNEDLDSQRRQVVVASLEMMGVQDADSRVVVGPAFAHGISGIEASRAYSRGLSNRNYGGGGGFGGGGGGFRR